MAKDTRADLLGAIDRLLESRLEAEGTGWPKVTKEETSQLYEIIGKLAACKYDHRP